MLAFYQRQNGNFDINCIKKGGFQAHITDKRSAMGVIVTLPVKWTKIFQMELALHTLPLKSKINKPQSLRRVIFFFFFFISKMGISTETLNGVDGNVTWLWERNESH